MTLLSKAAIVAVLCFAIGYDVSSTGRRLTAIEAYQAQVEEALELTGDSDTADEGSQTYVGRTQLCVGEDEDHANTCLPLTPWVHYADYWTCVYGEDTRVQEIEQGYPDYVHGTTRCVEQYET